MAATSSIAFSGQRGRAGIRRLTPSPRRQGARRNCALRRALEITFGFQRAAELALGPAVPVDQTGSFLASGDIRSMGFNLGHFCPHRDSRTPAELLVAERSRIANHRAHQARAGARRSWQHQPDVSAVFNGKAIARAAAPEAAADSTSASAANEGSDDGSRSGHLPSRRAKF
jgi:hypothetical protein